MKWLRPSSQMTIIFFRVDEEIDTLSSGSQIGLAFSLEIKFIVHIY